MPFIVDENSEFHVIIDLTIRSNWCTKLRFSKKICLKWVHYKGCWHNENLWGGRYIRHIWLAALLSSNDLTWCMMVPKPSLLVALPQLRTTSVRTLLSSQLHWHACFVIDFYFWNLGSSILCVYFSQWGCNLFDLSFWRCTLWPWPIYSRSLLNRKAVKNSNVQELLAYSCKKQCPWGPYFSSFTFIFTSMSRMYTASHPLTAGIGSSPPVTLKKMKQVEKMVGWIDLFSSPLKRIQQMYDK